MIISPLYINTSQFYIFRSHGLDRKGVEELKITTEDERAPTTRLQYVTTFYRALLLRSTYACPQVVGT